MNIIAMVALTIAVVIFTVRWAKPAITHILGIFEPARDALSHFAPASHTAAAPGTIKVEVIEVCTSSDIVSMS